MPTHRNPSRNRGRVRFALFALFSTIGLSACEKSPVGTEPPATAKEADLKDIVPITLNPQPRKNFFSAAKRPAGLPSFGGCGHLTVRRIGEQPVSKKQVLPLESTQVHIQVSGFAARTKVTQRFENPFETAIDAVYTFPLPEDATVDAMRLQIGERKVRAEIKRREEETTIYPRAKTAEHRAALAEQAETNIFTQSITGISPGDSVSVEIEYVDILRHSVPKQGLHPTLRDRRDGPRLRGDPSLRQPWRFFHPHRPTPQGRHP